jgi:hypothetical protein
MILINKFVSDSLALDTSLLIVSGAMKFHRSLISPGGLPPSSGLLYSTHKSTAFPMHEALKHL